MGGLNPEFKGFMEKHPDKTLLGLAWSLQWRFMLFVFALEILLVVVVLLVSFAVGSLR